jgi:hypothetical protein
LIKEKYDFIGFLKEKKKRINKIVVLWYKNSRKRIDFINVHLNTKKNIALQ